MQLHGRSAERTHLDQLLAEVRRSRGGAVVLRGEPGVGKSALLDWAAGQAGPGCCLRGGGVQSELELPFAVLHQLLRPVLDGIDRLPELQAAALRGALGLGPAGHRDPFLVAVAVLTLLTEAAAERGLLCLVDDAHWLDSASADVLLFVARRLAGERVALVFAARSGGSTGFAAVGLAELPVGGLDVSAAAALLAERFPDPAGRRGPDERLTRRLVELTGGNALALAELSSTLTPGQLTGAEPLPEPLPVGAGVERGFADVVALLPAAARQALTVAAAEDSGRIGVIGPACVALGVPLDALAPAEEAGLIRIAGQSLHFRHPLIRSAVYQRATSAARRAAHRALAATHDDVEDLDRRAWHLAAAAVGPDAVAAAALEESAVRARRRAGPAPAAAAFARAAALTADPVDRGRRLVAAAEAGWTAGRAEHALGMLDQAEALLEGPAARAGMLGMRGLIELSRGEPDAAYPQLVAAADAAADPPSALGWLALAGESASFSGHAGRMRELGRLAAELSPDGQGPQDALVVDMLTGVACAAGGDWAGAAPRLHRVLRGAGDDPITLLRAGQAALLLGDGDGADRLHGRAVELARRSGAIGLLSVALDRLALGHALAGRLVEAELTGHEGLRLAQELGQQDVSGRPVLALVAAWRGAADTCREHAEAALAMATTRRLGAVAAGANWALGLLELGLGRPAAALERLAPVVGGHGLGHPSVALWATPDLVEAAARAGRPDAGRAALAVFGQWARQVGSPWSIAAAHRGAAQLGGGDPAAFAAALGHHDGHSRPLDLARTQLHHGEALRRARRRTEARVALRAACETFDRLGAGPWAERARAELRASGESVGPRKPRAHDRLTPQELQIARLAARGASNPEIAGQLFLSRKTVEYHLHKVFTKLGIASRTELARLPLDDSDRGARPPARRDGW